MAFSALRANDERIDNLVDRFMRELRSVLFSAQARAVGRLRDALPDGAVVPSSQRFWLGIGNVIRESIQDAGYQDLVDAFVASWGGHMETFTSVLDEISAGLKTPLVARFGRDDVVALAAQRAGTEQAFAAVVDGVVAGFERRALFQVGSLAFPDLVDTVADSFSRAVPEAQTLASTSQVMFYRTIADRGFKRIEEKYELRYRYEGPKDRLTRPFCKKVLARTKKKPMTRAEIDKLDNGQLPNPFVTAGGFNCRHQWIVVEAREK